MRLFFCESTKFKSNFEVTEVACYCGNQVNGEIYNHEELRRRLPNHKFRTGSDCEVIAHLVGTLFSIHICSYIEQKHIETFPFFTTKFLICFSSY